MQPGPSDADLEKPLLEKLQGWGLLLVVFFVIWMPVVWLLEPSANVDDENELRQTSIDRGENAVQLFSEENPGGVGCVQCHGPGLSGGQNLFQGNVVTVPPLVNVCARLTLDQIKTTIEQGRPSTDMPSWSIRFQGALNDQQISEILDYVVELNRDNVPMEENKCLNPLAGTTPTASPTASPTP
jgi:mono/diheme cytochrome c family protein